MDVVAPLVTNREAAHAMEPSPRALHLPAIPSQPLAGVDASTRDTWLDVAPTQPSADEPMVVRFVPVRFVGALARRASWALHRFDVIEQRQHLLAVVDVGGGQRLRQRQTPAVYHQMVLGALAAAVRRIGTGEGPPFFAGTLKESTASRLQSMWPFSPNSSSRACWSASSTPAWAQSRSRRQHVTPLTPNTSRGSHSQGRPVRRTKRIPRRHARSSHGGRPPLGRGGRAGNSGATRLHKASGTSSRLIPAR